MCIDALYNFYLFGHPKAPLAFSNLLAVSYYFPDNLICHLKVYETSTFSESSFGHYSQSRKFRGDIFLRIMTKPGARNVKNPTIENRREVN